jgi:hypothetical protein
LGYQWSFGALTIPDATNDTLLLPSVKLTNSGVYTVAITNFVGSFVATANVTVVEAPKLGDISGAYEGPVGGAVNLAVSILNPDASMTFQWYRNGVAVSGATDVSYSFTATAESGGNYLLKAKNVAGETSSAIARVAILGLHLPATLVGEQVGSTLRITWDVAGQLEESSDLIEWTGVGSAGATSADITIAPIGVRFFRVVTP